MSASTFALTLTAFRKREGIAQAELGRRCNYDHSYLSRLEGGNRTPSRETVDRIAAALSLSDEDRAMLLHAAGFVSDAERSPISPLAIEVHSLMNDEHTPMTYRMMVAQVISALVGGTR